MAMLLGNPDLLKHIVTLDLLNDPPAGVPRFAQPVSGGFAVNIRVFRQADAQAKSRLRALLRIAIPVVVLGSGLVGFLAIGWLGLVLLIINLVIMQSTFVGSTRGSIDPAATGQAALNVKILALILYRWRAKSPSELAAWLDTEPQLKPLSDVLALMP